MADIDHLKKVNDDQEHVAGNEFIKRVAQVLTSAFRIGEVVARLGGDEFAVILPGSDAITINSSRQRVRQAVQVYSATLPEIPICLSLRLSTAEKASSLANVFKAAVKSMYREKRSRND